MLKFRRKHLEIIILCVSYFILYATSSTDSTGSTSSSTSSSSSGADYSYYDADDNDDLGDDDDGGDSGGSSSSGDAGVSNKSASFRFNQSILVNLSPSQSLLYERLKLSKSVNNPYKNLSVSQVCTGTSSGFSSSIDSYKKLKAVFTSCVYVDGNVEITNFNPYDDDVTSDGGAAGGGGGDYAANSYKYNDFESTYNFSFLDDIKEITGYLLIHNTQLKTLRFKNLQVIRGKSLILNTHSLFVDRNYRLEYLDLSNLKEIQRGRIYIQNNPKLCHMDEVNWLDLLPNTTGYLNIRNNSDPLKCPKCKPTCCNTTDPNAQCGCWFPNGCQKLTKIICESRCGTGRCYGPGPYDCCNSQCLGGCFGPNKNECYACTHLRIKKTGECVDSCPRIQSPDPITGDLVFNPNGMYQHRVICVDSCPRNTFIYGEFCLNKCPSQTYEDEELLQNPETGEKGLRRVCKPCTPLRCQKICYIDNELNISNIRNLENCEVLNTNLIITHLNKPNKKQLDESDLKILKSLKVINGFVRIQSNELKSLSFLSNLETIRGIDLLHNKYSVIVISTSLRTLGLNKLKSIENGIVHLQTDTLCLYDTINWNQILNKENAFSIKKENFIYSKTNCSNEGYVCDSACDGCWSNGPKSCQICKTYKLDDFCVETCDGNFINGKYTYLHDKELRECRYCHPECKYGCNGPSEFECKKCANFYVPINETINKCVDKCPISHYSESLFSENNLCIPCYKDCYGCTGPRDTISPNGCTKCNSALVNNDPAYSIIKCIEKDSYNCTNNEFSVLVPQSLKYHPLKGKDVCRKCNDECEDCFEYGFKLGVQCKKCKNFYSNSTGDCVKNCSFHNEYLEPGTKNCWPCNSECKFGCTGSGIYDCNQCRTYKLSLADVERLAKNPEFDMSNLVTKSPDEIINNKQLYDSSSKADSLYELIQNYVEFNSNRAKMKSNEFDENNDTIVSLNNGNDDEIVFCVSECPSQMPYKTIDNFCTDDPRRLASSLMPKEFKIGFILISTIVLILICLFVGFISCWKYKLKQHKLEKEYEEKFFSNYSYSEKNLDDSSKLNMSNLRLVNQNELELGKVLGRGAFGIVYEGYYKIYDQANSKVKVAIKVLNKCKFTDEKAITRLSNELMNEAKVMASVDHEYCLRLTALCIAEPMMMITQLMQYGSVVSFFQKYRDRATEIILLTWSKQIAEGMSYLESRGIVHRDLAARNILVKKFDHIKITDFGLARILDSSENGIYILEHSLVPFKWLAIESIQNRLFTHKSDVWSYGVCLWEIFTFCSKPYAEYPESEPLTIIKSIIRGTRLAKPQMASLDVYTILLRCWLQNPIARPDFKTLANEFSKMCLDPKRYLCINNVDFNKPFITIDDNTNDLLQEFKNNFYDDDDKESKSNGDLSTSEKTSDKSLKDDDVDSGAESIIVENNNKKTNNKKSTKKARSFFRNFNTKKLKSFKEEKDEESGVGGRGGAGGGGGGTVGLTGGDGRVITFKRSNSTNNKDSSNENQKHHFISSTKISETDSTNLSNDMDSLNAKNDRFKRNIKNILLTGLKPKRLESQVSSGTASTYLSYSYTSDTSSPRTNLNNETPNNFNFYEEQQALINAANTNSSFSSSVTPSRSNSNSSHSTHSTNSINGVNNSKNFDTLRPGSIYTNNNNNNNNNSRMNSFNNKDNRKKSDYLEPIMSNVIQNFEYFGNNNNNSSSNQQKPSVLNQQQSPEYKLEQPKASYYNDEISALLD